MMEKAGVWPAAATPTITTNGQPSRGQLQEAVRTKRNETERHHIHHGRVAGGRT